MLRYSRLLLIIVLLLCACARQVPPRTPMPTSAPTAALLPVHIVRVTSPVFRGSLALLTAQTVPGASCFISVMYRSGASTAAGLMSKTANAEGRVSWIWRVARNTTPGVWNILVMAKLGDQVGGRITQFTVY